MEEISFTDLQFSQRTLATLEDYTAKIKRGEEIFWKSGHWRNGAEALKNSQDAGSHRRYIDVIHGYSTDPYLYCTCGLKVLKETSPASPNLMAAARGVASFARAKLAEDLILRAKGHVRMPDFDGFAIAFRFSSWFGWDEEKENFHRAGVLCQGCGMFSLDSARGTDQEEFLAEHNETCMHAYPQELA